MDTKHQLRLNAYSVNDAGHILCNHEGRADERTAVLRIEAGRDIVERLLALVDEPRALRGTALDGSGVVLLFRCEGNNPVPYIPGSGRRDGVFKLAQRSGELVTITCASEGQTVDVSAYSWPKGRSPFEIERDRLPVLTNGIGAAVVEKAFKFATWAPTAEEIAAEAARNERLEKLRQEISEGKHTPEAIAAREDDAIVARYEGQEIVRSDGVHAEQILAARRRVANRKRLAAEAAAA